MPNAAILCTQLTDFSVRTYALWQGGLDVLKQPGTAGNLYGAPLESVQVTEAGPGAVSSMRYVVEDPSGTVPIPIDGTEVVLYDIASDHPEFRGYIQGVQVLPWPPSGRYLVIDCQGIEAVLDWKIVSGTYASASPDTMGSAIQSLAASAGLRDALDVGGSEGTQAAPISGIVAAINLAEAVTITNMTLRDAINRVWGAVQQTGGYGTLQVSVDFYGGLRVWHTGTTYLRPNDYISITVSDNVAGPIRGEPLSYDLVYGEIVRAVRVVGSSDFGTFSDGTGRPGPTVLVNDSTITTATMAANIAASYMGDRAVAVRGSFDVGDFDEGATAYRAGANAIITDAQIGLAASPFNIAQISKTYNASGRENWTVSFGGPPPRGSTLLRRLTRSQLS